MRSKFNYLFAALVAILGIVNLNMFLNNRAKERGIERRAADFGRERKEEFCCGIVCGSQAGVREALKEMKGQPGKQIDFFKDLSLPNIISDSFDIRSRDFSNMPRMKADKLN